MVECEYCENKLIAVTVEETAWKRYKISVTNKTVRETHSGGGMDIKCPNCGRRVDDDDFYLEMMNLFFDEK